MDVIYIEVPVWYAGPFRALVSRVPNEVKLSRGEKLKYSFHTARNCVTTSSLLAWDYCFLTSYSVFAEERNPTSPTATRKSWR
jgi:hypothetical protein